MTIIILLKKFHYSVSKTYQKMVLIMKYLFITLCILLSSLTNVQAAPDDSGGLSLHVTRVIYHEDDQKGVTLNIINNSDNDYLLQSTVRDIDPQTGGVSQSERKKMPFIITPPLDKFTAHSEKTLHIRRVNSIPLSDKDESAFFISLKAIPVTEQPDATGNSVVLATVINLKLFYRPKELTRDFIYASSSLPALCKKDNMLIAKNNTPYWLVFSSLKTDKENIGEEQLRHMIPPHESYPYEIKRDLNHQQAEWTLIDESGWITPSEKQTISDCNQ